MEVISISSFLNYYRKVREATLRLAVNIPADKMEWTYQEGKFTIGDLLRHIAAIERELFAECVMGRPIRYTGCGRELADGKEAILAYMQQTHEESLAIFAGLRDEDLPKLVLSPGGKETELRHLLRALIIHETHHRGALSVYLGILGIENPPLLGLTSEQVIEIAKRNRI